MSQNYIVVFKDHVTDDQIDDHIKGVHDSGGKVTNKYDSLLKGFSAKIPDEHLGQLQSLTGDVIDYIEPDGVVKTQK